MEFPARFHPPHLQGKVLRPLHVLYGLKQAGLAWWKVLNESMEELGFEWLKTDTGLFLPIQKGKRNHPGHHIHRWCPILWPLKSLSWKNQGYFYGKVRMLWSWGNYWIPLNGNLLGWLLISNRLVQMPWESTRVLWNNQCKTSLYTTT